MCRHDRGPVVVFSPGTRLCCPLGETAHYDAPMREHAGFAGLIGAGVAAIGGIMIGVGIAEAQAGKTGTAGLDLWGNSWFLAGVIVGAVGGAGLVVALIMYLLGPAPARRHGPDPAGATGPLAAGPAAPTDELRAGGRLRTGESLTSASGRYRLVMQDDGNLVLYHGRVAVRATGTARTGSGNYLALEPDGGLAVRQADGTVIWSKPTAGSGGNCLAVQDDGNVVLYADGGKVVWSSGRPTWPLRPSL